MTMPKAKTTPVGAQRAAPPVDPSLGSPFDVLSKFHAASAGANNDSPQVRSGQLISLALFSAAGKPCECSACGYLRSAFGLMLAALEEANSA